MSTRHDIRTKTVALVKDSAGKIATPVTTVWAPNTAYALGAYVVPKANLTGRIYKCIVAGASHAATEPAWPTADGGQVVDNTVTWQEEADDYGRAIDAAIKGYSKHRPDTKVVEVSGDGTHNYALPSGWVDGFSSIEHIEYPVDEVPEEHLDPDDDYTIIQTTTAKQIQLINDAPPAGKKFRVKFAVPRTDTTVPDNDVDAVADLAAALCLEILADAFVQTSDPTIAADVVNYRSKSAEAAARAKSLRALYKEHLGLKDDDTVPAASAVAAMTPGYPGGYDRLTHPKRPRRQRWS